MAQLAQWLIRPAAEVNNINHATRVQLPSIGYFDKMTALAADRLTQYL